MRKLQEFLKEVRVEFKHIRWPTKDELIGVTSAVLVFSVILSVIAGIFDYAFAQIIKMMP